MRRFVSFGPALLVLLAVVVSLAAAPAAIRHAQLASIASRVSLAQNRLDQGTILQQIDDATTAVAEAAYPGVVHIDVNGRRGSRGSIVASGSGWIYSDQGHIITNAHVVRGAESARVELFDGRVREATIVGSDDATDIAVLKIEPGAGGVIAMRRATGEAVKPGQRVYVLGSPFDFKFSMSEGIVSGLGRGDAARMVGMRSGYTNFIQTDAAMNPGNSGGPLVDTRGRVIGMSTAIANGMQQEEGQQQGQSAGIGFAVPLETVEAVVEQIVGSGVVLRGYLGTTLQDVNPLAAQRIGFDGTGVIIGDVQAGHPAAQAGLREGDIVTAMNGQPTPNVAVLRSLISIRAPGTTVTLRVWRDGDVSDMPVRLGGARISSTGQIVYVPGSEGMTRDAILAQIKPQDEADRALTEKRETTFRSLQQFGISRLMDTGEGSVGLVISAESEAYRAGLRTGHEVRSLNGVQVQGQSQLLDAIADLGPGAVAKFTVVPMFGDEDEPADIEFRVPAR